MVASGDVQLRRADPNDAEAIALAHIDSIRSIGPAFYPPDVVEAWGAGLVPDIYVKAMEGDVWPSNGPTRDRPVRSCSRGARLTAFLDTGTNSEGSMMHSVLPAAVARR